MRVFGDGSRDSEVAEGEARGGGGLRRMCGWLCVQA